MARAQLFLLEGKENPGVLKPFPDLIRLVTHHDDRLLRPDPVKERSIV